MKRIQAFLIGLMMILTCLGTSVPVYADDEVDQQNTQENAEESAGKEQTEPAVEITAPSAVLMEASTGTVIFEKDADTARPPASVTKVMTMLLIFDALSDGSISLDDEVTVSEYAASMGGSQCFWNPVKCRQSIRC